MEEAPQRKEAKTRIGVEGGQIKSVPESDQEKKDLNDQWQLIIRCDADSRVLCPVGSYMPGEAEAASFIIQG